MGKDWQGVTPAFFSDAFFYYSRMKEVKDGNIFIGNPYFIEHNREVAPAFFVADWVAALPLLLGYSFNLTVIFDLLFWPLVFVLLLYFFLKQLGISKFLCFLGSVTAYFAVYKLMFRFVSMQTVFPFFALFILAFIIWYKNPYSKKAIVFLILSLSFTYYIYTYLWQISLVFIFLFIIYFLIIKQKNLARDLSIILSASLILSIPLILYTIKQVLHPYYWESMERTGLVYTRLPAANVFYSGVWVVSISLLLSLSYFWIRELKINKDFKDLTVISLISGLAMLSISGNHIITNKELENSQHVERFITVWLVIIFFAFLYFFFKNIKHIKNISLGRQLIIILLIIFSFFGIIKYSKTAWRILSITTTRKINNTVKNEQKYLDPYKWLEENIAEPKVIWAEKGESDHYVTVLTKHYVLYEPSGLNYIVSSDEVNERYLVYNYFNDLKQSDLEDDYFNYIGVGLMHEFKTYNRKVKICRLLNLNYFGVACGELTDAVSFKGKDFFNELYKKYKEEITPNIIDYLKKYQVSYIVKEKGRAANFQPEKLFGAKVVYQDDNFLIYNINY